MANNPPDASPKPADPVARLLDAAIRDSIATRIAWARLVRQHPSFAGDPEARQTLADALLNPLGALQVLRRQIEQVPAIVAERKAEIEQEALGNR